MTSITISDKYGTYTISEYKDDLDITQMLMLVKRALLAAGYSRKIIEEHFNIQ